MRAAPTREWKPLEEAVPQDVFQAEVEAWARRIGVPPKVVQVRPVKQKWGSCSTAGRAAVNDNAYAIQPQATSKPQSGKS